MRKFFRQTFHKLWHSEMIEINDALNKLERATALNQKPNKHSEE